MNNSSRSRGIFRYSLVMLIIKIYCLNMEPLANIYLKTVHPRPKVSKNGKGKRFLLHHLYLYGYIIDHAVAMHA